MIPGVHRGFLHGMRITIMTSTEFDADNTETGTLPPLNLVMTQESI